MKSLMRAPVAQRRIGVALGSNLDDRIQHLRAGFHWLEKVSKGPILFSPIYETEPVDCPEGSASFLNAVCEIGYQGEILALLRRMQAFEQKSGRSRSGVRNAPRPLDLDLLYADDLIVNGSELILPHPRMGERRFVLQPLCDIQPDLVVPGQSGSISEILASLKNSGRIQVYPGVLREDLGVVGKPAA